MIKVDDIYYEILRQRKPAKLILKRFGKSLDITMGRDISRGNKATEVQKQIEELTGFNWETLSSVYVDQRSQNLLLTGTDREKKVVLDKIQRRDNFQVAAKKIKEDIQAVVVAAEEMTNSIDTARNQLLSVQAHVSSVSSLIGDVDALKAVYVKKKRQLERMDSTEKLDARIKALEKARKSLTTAFRESYSEEGKLRGELSSTLGRIKRLLKVEGQACPTCEQHVDKEHVSQIKLVLYEDKADIRNEQVQAKKKLDALRLQETAIVKRLDDLEMKRSQVLDGNAEIKADVFEAECKYLKAEANQGMLRDLNKQVKELKAEIKRCTSLHASLNEDKAFLDMCLEVVSRNGLPAYLNKYICPTLNAYAENYSNMITDGQIKVRFEVTDGDFEVKVLNLNGGENVGDQSEGETRLASLITSFAQRDVLAPCNVMILDEPGQGLDDRNSQVFAQKIAGIGKSIGMVQLITHNPYMIAELSDCRRIEIEKRKGISYVKES